MQELNDIPEKLLGYEWCRRDIWTTAVATKLVFSFISHNCSKTRCASLITRLLCKFYICELKISFSTTCPDHTFFHQHHPGDIGKDAIEHVFKTYGTVNDVHIMTGK